MISYRPLFQVEIRHDYFLSRDSTVFEALPEPDRNALLALYAVGNFLDIFPDQITLGKLAGHKMIFRTTATGFLVAVQTVPLNGSRSPRIRPAADFKLTFALRLKDGRFANYTELGAATTGFYRFGNDSDNQVAESCFLSQAMTDFDAKKSYVAGETYCKAADAAHDIYRAIRDTGPSAVPEEQDWTCTPNSTCQYVTAADAVLPVSRLFNLDIHDYQLPQARIRLFRSGSTTAVAEQTFTTAQGVLTEVQINLRGLAPGLYRLDVLDPTRVDPSGTLSIYLAPAAGAGGWFGAIEIGVGSGDWALLEQDGTLRSPPPLYVLRFLNRATRWRYLFPEPQPVGAGADVVPEEGGNDRILVTSAPWPLTRFGTGAQLQAASVPPSNATEEILLPGPEINLIRHQNPPQNPPQDPPEKPQWYSEIYLSNLALG